MTGDFCVFKFLWLRLDGKPWCIFRVKMQFSNFSNIVYTGHYTIWPHQYRVIFVVNPLSMSNSETDMMKISFSSIDSQSFLPKTHFLDSLEIFRLDTGKIGSNLLKKAFETWQHAFPSTSIAFYNSFAWACEKIKILRQESFWMRKWPPSLGFLCFFKFLSHPFLLLCYLLLQWLAFYWACFQFKKRLRKHYWDRQFSPWSSRM